MIWSPFNYNFFISNLEVSWYKKVSCRLHKRDQLEPIQLIWHLDCRKETNYNFFWSNLVLYNTDPKVRFQGLLNLRAMLFLWFAEGGPLMCGWAHRRLYTIMIIYHYRVYLYTCIWIILYGVTRAFAEKPCMCDSPRSVTLTHPRTNWARCC